MANALDRLNAALADRYTIERALGRGGPTLRCRRLREIALRIGLIIAPLIALAACASGPQGLANQPGAECFPWPSWQDFGGLPSLKFRIRFCGYDEASKEQLWEAQFRNDHRWGVSFSYAVGDEPVRHRMDLPAGRTRSSVPLLRTTATTLAETVWLRVEEYCAWATGQRSC